MRPLPRVLVLLVLLSLLALPLAADEADLSAALGIQDNRTPYAGAPLNYALTVTNHGPDRATGILARWTIPFDVFSYQIDRCVKQGDHLLICAAGALDAGQSTTFLIGERVPQQKVTMSASVGAAVNDPDLSNNDATFDLVPDFTPLVLLQLGAAPPPAEGRTSYYGLRVENRGGGVATAVHARWSITGDMTVKSGDCDRIDASTVDCLAAALAPGQVRSWSIGVMPGAAGGSIVSKATVTFAGGESWPGPVTATLESVIAANAALKPAFAAPSSVDANGNIAIHYTITNPSAVNADAVTLRLNSVGMNFVGATGADCRDAGKANNDFVVLCNAGNIAAGEAAAFDVIMRPPAAQGHFFAITAVQWGDPALAFRTERGDVFTLYHDIVVTTAGDGGTGSFRAALDEANSLCAGESFPCRITFSGPLTIEPDSPLPAITAPEVVIDGGKQTEIRGRHVFADGLVFRGKIGGVAGLKIRDFWANGIVASAGMTITGNEITGNGLRGITIDGNSPHTISGNVLANNLRSGLFVAAGRDLTIKDNRVIDNGASGMYFGPTVGTVEIGGNTVAGNRDFGIAIDSKAKYFTVRENSIHDNGIDAIDIGLDGPSDPRQPHRPVITGARYDAASGDTIITARVDPTGPTGSRITATVLFFANPKLDASGRAEAETFLGSAVSGGEPVELRVHADLRGQFITALNNVLYVFYGGEFQYTDVSELSDGVEVF